MIPVPIEDRLTMVLCTLAGIALGRFVVYMLRKECQ